MAINSINIIHMKHVCGLITMLLSFAFSDSVRAADQFQIKVLQIKGMAKEEVGKAVFTLRPGSIIRKGGKVIVSEESSVVLALGKDVVTKLEANSSATMTTTSHDQKDWELNLLKGISTSAVRNPEKRPNHFQVRNRTVTLGVRGTVFYTENLENKPIFLCTCHGSVSVLNDRGKQLELITTTHHDRPIELEEQAGSKILTVKTAPMGTGHTDADVQFLENELNKL